MNASEVCCVCHDPSRPIAQRLGGRAYCADDYQRATRPNQSLIRTLGIMVIGLTVFSAVISLAGSAIQIPSSALFLVGLILALVPAVAWLWFFYSQDRLEPEPRGFVLGVFVLAALLTDFAAPRIFAMYDLGSWLPTSDVARLVGSVLVRGILYSAIAWATVRYTVYPTSEFDERMDGIVYGTAAGLGIATMLNINYVMDSGGVLLGPGVVNIVVTTLAQASFGGLVGYFLGESKFIDEPMWWMPTGVGVAAILNGVFLWAAVEVKASGTGVNELYALILAAVVAIATFAGLIFLMRRAIENTLGAQASAKRG